MMKVKIINADNTWDLESKINEFLKITIDDRVLDIKYQGVGNTPAYSTNRPSAMIILKW